MGHIRKIIQDAEVIVYLGFSFGEMNMRLLSTNKNTMAQIFGTSHGISEPNRQIVMQDVQNSFGENGVGEINLVPSKCNELLNDYWKPILRG